ncbi:DUF3240 family protein [Methylobacter sp.]|uniref:DUF3240 family protein n=1 Tax=Methylobacter sp. TaxID=2051955 RepID=UPI003DA454A5
MNNGKEYLVTLNVPPGLEEAVVDNLLVLESEHGFSSFIVNSHDHRNEGLSLLEQVTGRQKKIRFQMYVPERGLPVLLAQLRQEFAGSGIHYWVLPIIENGFI